MSKSWKEWVKTANEANAKHSAVALEARSREASAHPAACDAEGWPIIAFEPPLLEDSVLSILSPTSDGSGKREVGKLQVKWLELGVVLDIELIQLNLEDGGRGYAGSALRVLIDYCRERRVKAISGRIAPYRTNGDREGERQRLRRFYERAGFVLDHEGELDKIWFNVEPEEPLLAGRK